MRNRNSGYSADGQDNQKSTDGVAKNQVAYDGERFFKSFYRSSVKSEISDRTTIGNDFSLMESRFHYNATENSILRALARRSPPPHGPVVAAAEALTRRRRHRLLDLGSGTGHWIDFFKDVLLVGDAVGVEITDLMIEYLRAKYSDASDISVLQQDICADEFTSELIGGPVDYISAIGIMFHIVDDGLWELALGKLATMLKPDGLLIVGGDFGAKTENVQFHKTDEFESWREYAKVEESEIELRVNKRVRSLADWQKVSGRVGLSIVDLVRTEGCDSIRTPENDILVLALN